MSTFPTFDQIDHSKTDYSGIKEIIADELRIGDSYNVWLERVARQYDAYCTLKDRPHKFGDWLEETGEDRWQDKNFFSPEQQFHLNAIRQQLNWRDAGKDPERRNYKSQIGSIVTTTQDTPLGGIDEQRDYHRDIGETSKLLTDDTRTSKIIYIGGYEYICRNKVHFNLETGPKKVWWDHIIVEEPDGRRHEVIDEGRFAVMTSRLRKEVPPPDGTEDWIEFAAKRLLPIHVRKYGFMQPVEHHMDWVEEHIMGIPSTGVSSIVRSETQAMLEQERLAFYEANETALF